MMYCTIVNEIRTNNKIEGYILRDIDTNVEYTVSSNNVKKEILNNNLKVLGLSVNSNRLTKEVLYYIEDAGCKVYLNQDVKFSTDLSTLHKKSNYIMQVRCNRHNIVNYVRLDANNSGSAYIWRKSPKGGYKGNWLGNNLQYNIRVKDLSVVKQYTRFVCEDCDGEKVYSSNFHAKFRGDNTSPIISFNFPVNYYGLEVFII